MVFASNDRGNRSRSLLLESAVIVLMMVCSSLHAQQLALKTYTRANGLASDYVLCIYQDRDGYMWFGTDRGASRYDGRTFTTYTTDDGLPSNFIHCIFQEKSGAMWFGTYDGGIARFNGRKFRSFTTRDGLPSNEVSDIFQDRFDRIYFRTAKSLCYVRPDSSIARLDPAIGGGYGPLPDGSLLVTKGEKFLRMIPSRTDSFQFVEHRLLSQQHGLLRGDEYPWARANVVYAQGQYWIASGGRLLGVKIDSSGDASVRAASLGAAATSCESDAAGNIWVSTDGNGIAKFDGNRPRWITERNGLARMRVRQVFRDYEGSLWFATMGGGAQKLLSESVVSYRTSDGLLQNEVTTVFEDSRKRVWVGTGRGISLIENNRIRNDFPFQKLMDEVRAFAEDKNGNLYIGTFAGVYGPIAPELTQRAESISFRGIGYGTSSIAFLDASGKGEMWVSSYGGGTHRITNDKDSLLTTKDGLVSNMFESMTTFDNSVWFLTRSKGANRFRDGRWEAFSTQQGLPSSMINAVFEEKTGDAVWFGTSKGAVRISNGRIDLFDETKGLRGNNVVGIFPCPDAQECLMIVTEKSLHKFSDGMITPYGPVVLLPFAEMKVNRLHYSQATSSLWLATTGGVVKVDLSHARSPLSAPRVVITRVAIDSLMLVPAMHLSLSPTFTHEQNNPSFQFAGLSFADEDEVSYRFKLSGVHNAGVDNASVDNAWSELTSDPRVQYRNLGAGHYAFSVIAVNADGVVSAKPAEFVFRILPPFWRTWWFGGAMLVLVAGTFGGVIRYVSTRKLRKKVEELERERAIQQERERISRDLHDHVGAQLVNIISGLDLVGKYSPPTEKRSERLLKSLQQDARSSMMQLRETIWAIRGQSMPLAKFVEQVENYSRRQMEFQDDAEFFFESHCDGDVELSPVQVLNCFRIVQEALTNCAKHAKATNIRVEVHSTPDSGRRLPTGRVIDDSLRLKILVRDDGVGLQNRTNGELHGNGVLNMTKRAEEIGGTFSMSQVNGRGTEVRVEIPTP